MSRDSFGRRVRRPGVVAAVISMMLTSSGEGQVTLGGLSPEAVALLEQSIAAHQSRPARLRLSYRGSMASPDQSLTADGPFRRNVWTVNLAIDDSAGTVSYDPDLVIDGGFHFRNPVGFAGGRGFALDYTGQWFDELNVFPTVADAYLPHRQLRTVLATARSGEVRRDSSGDRLTYTMASGDRNTLVFDPKTHLLLAIQRGAQATVYGDQTRESRFGPYRRVAGIMVPEVVRLRLANPIHGTFERGEMRLVGATEGGPRPDELATPRGATRRPANPRAFETVELGRDVYLLRNVGTAGLISYNVLLAIFEDHVLVVEAALNDATSRRVLEAAERIAPGKPVRRVVQTHHHGDHISGIRTYIANGASVVAPQGMRDLLTRVAMTQRLVSRDSQAAPLSPLIEEVQRERTIRDGRNELRLYDLSTEHSQHMLVAYFPEQRVLYQGDLVNAGELPLNATSHRFLDWLRAQRLPVAALAGTHGETLRDAPLRTLLTDRRE